ncbi:MAG: GspH/FimT family pseudopilin [Candidatus Omnitrophica bacterium]|nr:GspH/FimT family pseudopilin [Candidatus Omnitrophota bacterium]
MTLVEILVVLAIIGMLFGMGLPAMMQFANRLRFQATTRQMVGLISLARSTAISQHEDHAVVFDDTQRIVRVVRAASNEPLERVIRLPSTITIELSVGGEPSEDDRLTFTSSGSLAGRSVVLTLTDQKKTQTITVTSATGAITVE